MENSKQKKKVSYDDILASLKMSMNSNGKLEIVRTDAGVETKLKDQITQKYVKPIKPNNNKNQNNQYQNQNYQNQQNNQKQQIQQQIRSHYNKPVTRVPIKPILTSSIVKPNYLNSYYSNQPEQNKKINKEIKQETPQEIKLKIVEIKEEIKEESKEESKEDELTEEEKQEQQEYYKEQYRQYQQHNRDVLLHRIQQHNERVWINQTKSKKLLFASSNIQISPIPINNLFGLK